MFYGCLGVNGMSSEKKVGEEQQRNDNYRYRFRKVNCKFTLGERRGRGGVQHATV